MHVKKNKKICHLTSVHPVFDIRIFYKECSSLTKAGYQVKLIAPNCKAETKNGVEIVPIKLPISRFKRFLFVTFKMTDQALSQKCDIYHFHDPELMFCGVLLKIFGKKVIFDIHENVRLSFVTKEWIPKPARNILSWFYFILERFALLFFDKLILAEESYQKYYPKRKSNVILNYPLSIENSIAHKEFSPPFRFVYSGVIHELRGIWEMLDLIKFLKDQGENVRLDLIGEIRPSSLKDEIKSYILDNELESIVQILGKVDFSEVGGFLKNGYIGLSLLKPIPNYRESLPTKIFEYMLYGLPVITNDFPLYKRYVADEETGLCLDITDNEMRNRSVLEMLWKPESLAKMSANGIRLTSDKCNWQTQENKLINIYQTL